MGLVKHERSIKVKSRSGKPMNEREKKWAGKAGYFGGLAVGAPAAVSMAKRSSGILVNQSGFPKSKIALKARRLSGRIIGGVGGGVLGSAIGIGAGIKLGQGAAKIANKLKKKKVKESSIATFLDRKDQIRVFEALILRRQALINLQEAKDDKKGIVGRRTKKGALVGALAGGSYGAGQWGVGKHLMKPSIDALANLSNHSPKVVGRTTGGLHIGAKGAKGALVGAGLGAGAGLVGRLKRRKKK